MAVAAVVAAAVVVEVVAGLVVVGDCATIGVLLARDCHSDGVFAELTPLICALMRLSFSYIGPIQRRMVKAPISEDGGRALKFRAEWGCDNVTVRFAHRGYLAGLNG